MRASSVGGSTVGDILLRVSVCSVVLNDNPAKHSLFSVPDTPMTLTRDWIEPGPKIINYSWARYRDLVTQGYTYRTVNHSIQFVNLHNGAHTNTKGSTWRSATYFIGKKQPWVDYEFNLANYMFAERCITRRVPPFLQFLHLVANTDWSQYRLPRSADRTTC